MNSLEREGIIRGWQSRGTISSVAACYHAAQQTLPG
jgi:hypothetical protein